MKPDILTHYFRKLRMLYCSELQLISFLPELSIRAKGQALKGALAFALTQSRRRRDELELLAHEHQISAAGDDCQSMRRLIGESRAALRSGAWHFPGDDAVASVEAALHRLQLLNYGVARSLAGRTRMAHDAGCIDLLLDDLIERYPEACGAPIRAGLLHEAEFAVH